MKIEVEFAENKKVKCHFNGFTVESDQSVESGGDGSSPEPFDYFLSSSALCAGFYIKSYLEARKIDSSNIKIIQENHKDSENKYLHNIDLKVIVPEDLDEKHRQGIMRAVELCSVKKAIVAVPKFTVSVEEG